MVDKVVVDCSKDAQTVEAFTSGERADRNAIARQAEQQADVEGTRRANRTTIEHRLDQAIVDMTTIIVQATGSRPSTTGAQLNALYDGMVRMARVVRGLARLERNQLDDVD